MDSDEKKKKIKDTREVATQAFDNSEIEAIKQASLQVEPADIKKRVSEKKEEKSEEKKSENEEGEGDK